MTKKKILYGFYKGIPIYETLHHGNMKKRYLVAGHSPKQKTATFGKGNPEYEAAAVEELQLFIDENYK